MINFKVELIKLLSCMDAVFKLLHVEVARKAIDGSEKKNGANIEMGYCPFEHKVGRAVQGSWARGAEELGSRGGEVGAQAGALGAGLKRAGHDTGCAGRSRARGTATRQPGAAIRLAGRPQHGHCTRLGVPVRTWVCCWARLCTWCTQLVFGLSTVSESLFGHCS